MLSKLTIDNYALIDHSEINFDDGFSVITGETGAGKSIMLDAISLLRGVRADLKAIGDKEKKTLIEADFISPDNSLKEILEENGIEWDPDELILRREISPAGKSRTFINDSPVNLKLMSEVSDYLIDIHSQHNNNTLSDNIKQLELLDVYSGNRKERDAYKNSFRKYISLRKKIKDHKEQQNKIKENKEFIIFRLEQLDKLKPKKDELAALEREYDILSDADHLKTELGEAWSLIEGNEVSAIKMLNRASTCLEGIDLSLFNSDEDESIAERIQTLKIELKDVADTLTSYIDDITSNPERCRKLKERIDKINELIRRFKVKDENELVALHEKLKKDLMLIEEGSADISEWEKELKQLAANLKERAEDLSSSRKRAAEEFSKELEEKIRPLGMPNVKFDIEVNPGKLTPEGQDSVEFTCSFNKNHKQQPLKEIASGGEISRVMLGIKSIMATKMKLPTVIFDEIDTGVSGEIASLMGRMMKDMSAKMQVMSVTHLPQVAASGSSHFKVYKKDNNERTISNIKRLDAEERVKEIAGMLSGTRINEAAVRNARILLEQE